MLTGTNNGQVEVTSTKYYTISIHGTYTLRIAPLFEYYIIPNSDYFVYLG
jgi:hypothetical protein